MSVGRYFCVALPFVLTVASIVCVLIAGLTGVVNNNLYLMKLNLTETSIDATELAALLNGITDLQNVNLNNLNISDSQIQTTLQNLEQNLQNLPSSVSNSVQNKRNTGTWHDSSLIQELGIPTGSNAETAATAKNITAQQLGLANTYQVTVWGYCADWPNGVHNCTAPRFNWAENQLNTKALAEFNKLAGINITIPAEVEKGLDAFEQVAKWTQIIFIIACIALGIEFVVGIFTACSRAVSCVTWLVSFIATAAVIAAAALMTTLSLVVVGAVEGSLSKYGANAHVNTTFLAIIWLGAAFALAASFFWLFSICCCKPESRPHKSRSSHADGEKLLPVGAYQPIGEHHAGRNNYNYGVPQRGGARSDLAYEPYSHSNV
ncbi:SUR7/PalI family-domain-containing protein [Microdochium trichocladiopsis]|uniref:SUR7/PalI family-domain-containing protein n=1 Tax=Microdochium trichocladiopsis TaxID=1682393 RepID=A0A9P8Y489_9PEZI|nr:SUR7/PalI family-domain-containing protein [Microdochium trichocladiopsis]KAH7027657.1 SUR7/PalI family-domain-containing protein [Microdochium trichocladiopsis]